MEVLLDILQRLYPHSSAQMRANKTSSKTSIKDQGRMHVNGVSGLRGRRGMLVGGDLISRVLLAGRELRFEGFVMNCLCCYLDRIVEVPSGVLSADFREL